MTSIIRQCPNNTDSSLAEKTDSPSQGEVNMLDVNLFGIGQAFYLDQPLAGFPRQQPSLLLCYLLLNRNHPQDRDGLAAVFWADCTTELARKHLRNALWRLRTTLKSAGASPEEYLSIGEDSVSFLTSSRYRLDIELFETVAARYRDIAGQNLNPSQAAELEQVADLYAGDLLQGLDADWCLYDRERLSLARLNILGKLMAFCGDQQDYERGLAFGERILSYDNTRETVHREMMRLYWLSGNRNAALTQYRRCAQILHEEFGLPPTEETQSLYQKMVHGQFLPDHDQRRHVSPSPDSISSRETARSLTERLIHKVHELKVAIEETETDLRSVEELLDRTLRGAG